MTPVAPAAATTQAHSSVTARQQYECTLLLTPGISPEEVKNIIKSISVEIAGLGGEVQETDIWGRRGLAYSIGGSTEAVFAVLLFAIPHASVQELSRSISIMKSVLRHLLVKPEPGAAFVRYSERYEQWLQEREQREKEKQKEKEEKLKKQILKKVAAPKPPLPRRAPVQEEAAPAPEAAAALEERLEEIISDENLRL